MDDVALLASIIDNPDEDTPRLMYADWLDEFGCGDRAELIRVQCELARLKCVAVIEGERHWVVGQDSHARHLIRRESAILAAHPEWFPKCPMCKGHGFIAYHSEGECPHCDKPGRVGTGHVGTFARGFLDSVKVRTIADVLEPCVNCEARDLPCPLCGGRQYYPTRYATELIRDYPTLRSVVPVDRVPNDIGGGKGRWYEADGHRLPEYQQSCLPPMIHAMLEGGEEYYYHNREYDTHEIAIDALGVAVLKVMKGK